jgi:hypothetical protein
LKIRYSSLRSVLGKAPASKPRIFPGRERLKKIQAHAKESGGQLLFMGARSRCGQKVYLTCKRGHVWAAAMSSLTRKKKPTWCNQAGCFAEVLSVSRDSNLRESRIDEVKRICEFRNWSWESGEYLSLRDKNLKITCACPKEELYSLESLRAEKACIECYRRTKKEDLQKRLRSKEISVISNYVDEKTSIHLRCDICEHPWKTTPSSVRGTPSNSDGTGCPKCNGGVEISEDVINERAKFFVERYHGKIINEERRFSGGRERYQLEVQCKETNHEPFWTDIYRLQNGNWCTQCRTPGIYENAVRLLLEHLIGEPLTKARPSWLVNSGGNQMELDGYNEELGLAFEYQGEQHFYFVPFFHESKADFHRRLEDDKLKKKLCKARDIVLLCPDYLLDPDGLEFFLRSELTRLKPQIKLNSDSLNWREMDIGNEEVRRNYLRELIEIAEAKGGKCLSNVYINNHTKLRFTCANKNHDEWAAVPYSIKSGTWCKNCGDEKIGEKNKTPVQKIKELCGKKDLIFLDICRNKHGQIAYKVAYRCSHEFILTKKQIDRDTACQICFQPRRGETQRYTIEDARKLAVARNGKLLSQRYLNSNTKLLWQCAKIHTWTANLKNIKGHKNKKGSWCPECAGKNPWVGNIDEFLSAEKEEWVIKFGEIS